MLKKMYQLVLDDYNCDADMKQLSQDSAASQDAMTAAGLALLQALKDA